MQGRHTVQADGWQGLRLQRLRPRHHQAAAVEENVPRGAGLILHAEWGFTALAPKP